MPAEKVEYKNTNKNYEDLVKRREALQRLALMGSLAFLINPILSIAYTPTSSGGGKRKIEAEILENERWSEDLADIYHVKLSVSVNGEGSEVTSFVVRDAPDMILPPLVIISESKAKSVANILAVGSDDEYIQITSELYNDKETYLDKIIQIAQMEKKKKVERYTRIIKEAYNKRKAKKNLERANAHVL